VEWVRGSAASGGGSLLQRKGLHEALTPVSAVLGAILRPAIVGLRHKQRMEELSRWRSQSQQRF
jgi:hypothetical protein